MEFDLSTASYRLFRLRRLVAVALLVPLLPFGLAMLAGAPVGWWLIGLWTALVIAHVLRFPHAWADLVALALVLALALFLAPIGGRLGVGPVAGYGLALSAGFIAWVALGSELFALDRYLWPLEPRPLRRRLRMTPDEARAALFLRPNAQLGSMVCGPADPDGIFDMAPAGTPPDAGFLVRILRGDDLSQELVLVDAALPDQPVRRHVSQALEATKRGVIYEQQEAGDAPGLASGLGLWLTDSAADELTDTLDRANGRPSRANCAAGRDGPLDRLAAWFAARQERRVTAP